VPPQLEKGKLKEEKVKGEEEKEEEGGETRGGGRRRLQPSYGCELDPPRSLSIS